MSCIEIHDYFKEIKGNVVLDHITARIQDQTVGFVGRNGAGKTMLFRAIAGLIHPTSGEIKVDGLRIGKDISSPPSIGVIIENIGLWPDFTGFRNLKMLAGINKRIGDAQIRETIARVGLDPSDKRPVGKYSLGMRQRIVLAQALMESPDLLLLDEPTNSLDEAGVTLIRNILKEERERGATILIASHNKEDIDLLCETIYHLDAGKIIRIEQRPGEQL